VDEKVAAYARALAVASGGDDQRAARVLVEAKTAATRASRAYVIPDDVKSVAASVIVLPPDVLRKILDETPVP
jgi:hypothetical protein